MRTASSAVRARRVIAVFFSRVDARTEDAIGRIFRAISAKKDCRRKFFWSAVSRLDRSGSVHERVVEFRS